MPEVVAHGDTGLLVKPADSAALAGALAEVLKSRERLRDMGEAGRARVERKYSRGAMLRQTEGMYRALLARRR